MVSIILAGDRSGTGKTTLTLALLAALKNRAHSVRSFKVGPDYIDPMFHAAVTDRPCYNLDPVLTSPAYVQHSYRAHCADADYAVIEGVMGLFDGATGIDDTASTAHVARLLKLPVLLVVDAQRMSRSLAALVQGYRDFDSRVSIAGVILNRVGSDRHLQLLSDALDAINMPIFGVFRREQDIQLPDRHLGLVPTAEVSGFDKIAKKLAAMGERCFDWEKLRALALTDTQNRVEGDKQPQSQQGSQRVRIAIAKDLAFNFYYADNFEALTQQGAELIEWSPLEDEKLPEVEGLYFGGGFPEVFAGQLAANEEMKTCVREAIARGMPTYAECGGLMYLSNTLVDFDRQPWPMVGAISQTVRMGGRLALGYRQALAKQDGPLLTKGQTVVGHEFHRSAVVEAVGKPSYETQRYWGEAEAAIAEGYCVGNLHASYVHLGWGDRPEIPQRFVQKCAQFKAFRQKR